MNLIDYNQAVEALENERKLLLNREQYGAENVLVHHALNVISELPIVRQPKIVRCNECKWWGAERMCENSDSPCFQNCCTHGNWFCADGERRCDDG